MLKSLALLGLPGCGKTYWGRKLASHHGVHFFDLDVLIEKEAGITITEIFHEGGEHLFRSIESSTLYTLCQNYLDERFVLSLGGGTPAFSNNMEILNSCCTSIYLNLSIESISQNLLKDTETHRPLVKKTTDSELLVYLKKLKIERESAYLLAHYQLFEKEISIPSFEKILNDTE